MFLKRILSLSIAGVSCLAQSQPAANSDDPTLAAGRKLVADLKLDQEADAAMFRILGLDAAGKLMTAIQSADMRLTATAAEQAELHRATAGMIELSLERGNYFLAAMYSTVQAANYDIEDNYKLALVASRQALDFQQKSGMTETLDIPWVQVGRDLMKLREPAEALRCFQQALQWMSDPAVKRTGWTKRYIVQAELASGNLAEGREESVRFLETSKNGIPEYRAAALLAWTDVLIEEQKFDAVLDTLKEVWATKADEMEATSQLFDCNLLAMRSLGYDQAMAVSKRIDVEFREFSPPGAALARRTMEYRRRMAGDMDGLLRDEAASLAAARSSKNVAAQIEALQMMAASYRAANSVGNQIAALKEAAELEKSLLTTGSRPNRPDAVGYLHTLNTLGDAYLKLNQIGKGRQAFNEVIATSEHFVQANLPGQSVNVYGEALVGRAKADALDDDSENARKILENALHAVPAAAKFNRKDVLWQLARLERDERRNSQAANYYTEAVRWIHESGSFSSPADEAYCRIEFAHFLIANGSALPGSKALAETQLAAAQDVIKGLAFSEIQWRIFYQRGLLAEAMGDKKGALAIYRGAIARLEEVRESLEQEQRQSLIDKELIQDLYLRALSLTADLHSDSATWDMLERVKARSFVDALAGRRFRGGDVVEPARAAIDVLENRIASLRVGSLAENAELLRESARPLEARPGELEELQARLQFARAEDSLSKSRAGMAVAAKPVTLARIREALPPGTALVEFGLIDTGIVAILATPEGSRQIGLRTDVRQLGRDILVLSRMLGRPSAPDDHAPLLRSISERVIQPVLKDMPPNVHRLILVPAGVLHYLPFQALLMDDGQSVIDRFTVSYLPSGSVLEFLPTRTEPSKDLFLGAIGNTSVEGKDPLPGTLQEADAIAALYPNPVRASEGQFTHDQVRTALLTHDVVHLATHGIYDERAPMFSALLVAGPAGTQTRLSVYELPDMNIRARTVILSACETGKGKITGGDEMAGLTQAILLAGADTVVSSLWQVSDNSTSLLMQGFHRRLLAGASAAQALRDAALDVRKRYPDPFYWAPFVVTGAI